MSEQVEKVTEKVEPKTAPDEKPAKAAAVPDVVAHLADMLHRATQGEIVAIATAAVQRGTRLPIIGWGAHNNDTTNDLTAAIRDLDFAIADMRAERQYPAPRAAPGQPTEASHGQPADAAATG